MIQWLMICLPREFPVSLHTGDNQTHPTPGSDAEISCNGELKCSVPLRCLALSQPSPAAGHDHFGLAAPFLLADTTPRSLPALGPAAARWPSPYLGEHLLELALGHGHGGRPSLSLPRCSRCPAGPGAAGPALHKHRKRPRARFRRRRRCRASRGGHRAAPPSAALVVTKEYGKTQHQINAQSTPLRAGSILK